MPFAPVQQILTSAPAYLTGVVLFKCNDSPDTYNSCKA